MKSVFDIVHDRAQHLLSFPDALLGHDDVAAAGDDTRTDHPDVQIVNIEDAAHALDRRIRAGMSMPAGVPSSSTAALSRRTP